jgi:putative membrane protein
LTNWILRWVISGVALFVVTKLNIGVEAKDVTSLAIATVVIGLLNSFVKPILVLLTLPLNCLTFGLFSFVLNAILFKIADILVDGFVVEGWVGALVGPIIMGVISGILNSVLVDRNKGEE